MQLHLKACAAQLLTLAASVREQSNPTHLAHAIATGFEHMAQAFEHGLGIGAPAAPVDQPVAAPAAAAAPADALTERAKRMAAAFAAATGVSGGWDDAPEVIRAGWLAAAGAA